MLSPRLMVMGRFAVNSAVAFLCDLTCMWRRRATNGMPPWDAKFLRKSKKRQTTAIVWVLSCALLFWLLNLPSAWICWMCDESSKQDEKTTTTNFADNWFCHRLVLWWWKLLQLRRVGGEAFTFWLTLLQQLDWWTSWSQPSLCWWLITVQKCRLHKFDLSVSVCHELIFCWFRQKRKGTFNMIAMGSVLNEKITSWSKARHTWNILICIYVLILS